MRNLIVLFQLVGKIKITSKIKIMKSDEDLSSGLLIQWPCTLTLSLCQRERFGAVASIPATPFRTRIGTINLPREASFPLPFSRDRGRGSERCL